MSMNVVSAPKARARAHRQAAIDRAMAKAHEQARAGNVPTLLRSEYVIGSIVEVWAVGSRTVAGSVYTIDLRHDEDGVETRCDCAAAAAERICWHRAACRLAHEDRIGCHNVSGYRIRPRAPRVAAMAAD